MSKRTILFIILFLVLAAFLVYFFVFRGSPAPNTQGIIGTLPSTTTSTINNQPIPQGDSFTIQTTSGGVSVKNFYKTAVDQDQESVLAQRTDEFDLTYFRDNSSFLITLSSTPLAKAHADAENALLQTLGINQQDACKLNVREGIPEWVDENSAGSNYSLSFCPSGVPL